MGFMILPVVVLCLFLGITAVIGDQSRTVLPASPIVEASQAGEAFIAYRNALIAFQQNNPGFTGSVSPASLQGYGRFSVSLLASAGNAITAFGSNGRVTTAYATVPPAAISRAVTVAEGDASIGIANGSAWTGFYAGAPTVPLTTGVPNGAIVSVTQTGN